MTTMQIKPIHHEPMKCKFCEQPMVLIPVRVLLNRQISSLDFDEDGRQYKICPNCFSLDNFNLRESRALIRAIQDNQITFSQNDKKKVLKYLCRKAKYTFNQNKETVNTMSKELKHRTDKNTVKTIATHFNVPQIKVSMLFYNVQVYWMLMRKEE